MKIAVTGANGFVGQAVADLVHDRGHDVVTIDKSQEGASTGALSHELDVSDYDAFVEALSGCEALIHLAAINGPGRHPDHMVHNNNVVSSYNALRGAAEAGIRRVCQASSVNAIGGRFSLRARYDYFPVDERHPTYAEDPYSLSKWICEQQADAIGRRNPGMAISSLRFHGVVADLAATSRWVDAPNDIAAKQLWGYTLLDAAAQACLLGVTADFSGHEAFYIVAPTTMMTIPSRELASQHYPEVPLVGDMSDNRGFFDCSKAAAILGWEHEAASQQPDPIGDSP